MVSESIIGATIDFAKLFASIKVTPIFSDFCLCGNLTIATYKLIEMNF